MIERGSWTERILSRTVTCKNPMFGPLVDQNEYGEGEPCRVARRRFCDGELSEMVI